MIKYFPELRGRDNFITEFNLDLYSKQIQDTASLNPDTLMFKKPDFGFNGVL